MADNINSLDIRTERDIALGNATTYSNTWNRSDNWNYAAPAGTSSVFTVVDNNVTYNLSLETSGSSTKRGAACSLYGEKGINSTSGRVIYTGSFNSTNNIFTITPWFGYQYTVSNSNVSYTARGTVTVLGTGTYTSKYGETTGVKMRINKRALTNNISWTEFDFWAYLPESITISCTTKSTEYELPSSSFIFE